MNWQVLIIISVISGAISLIFQRFLMLKKQTDPIAVSIATQILIALLISVLLPFRQIHQPNFTHVWINLALMVVLYALGTVFRYISLKKIEVSYYTVLYQTRVLWVIALSLVFLHEKFAIYQLIGVFLLISSILLLHFQRKEIKFDLGSNMALFSAATIGIAFFNDAFIIQTGIDVPLYLVLAFILPALGLWVVYPRATHAIADLFNKGNIKYTLIISIFWALASLTMYYAYSIGHNASKIYSLNQISIIVTIILAIIFLKETDNIVRKMISAALSIVGVLLLMWPK